jgi:hypothetical protein
MKAPLAVEELVTDFALQHALIGVAPPTFFSS